MEWKRFAFDPPKPLRTVIAAWDVVYEDGVRWYDRFGVLVVVDDREYREITTLRRVSDGSLFDGIWLPIERPAVPDDVEWLEAE